MHQNQSELHHHQQNNHAPCPKYLSPNPASGGLFVFILRPIHRVQHHCPEIQKCCTRQNPNWNEVSQQLSHLCRTLSHVAPCQIQCNDPMGRCSQRSVAPQEYPLAGNRSRYGPRMLMLISFPSHHQRRPKPKTKPQERSP